MRKADYIIGIVNEDSTTRGAEVQRSVFALKIDHDTIGIDEEGALKVEGVCVQKGARNTKNWSIKTLGISRTAPDLGNQN